MSRLIPDDLLVPPGMDARQFILSLPALGADQIPRGADTTMTANGPDQIWFLAVAIACIAVPGLFLILRVYTRLAIMRCLEPADCECRREKFVCSADNHRLFVSGIRKTGLGSFMLSY